METTLKDAFEMASKLSPREQNLLAKEIIFNLKNEQEWKKEKRIPKKILELAEEAKEEYRKGNLEELDPDSL